MPMRFSAPTSGSTFDRAEPTEIIVGGDGNAPISYTSRPSIGSFLAYVLTQTPKHRLLELASQPSSHSNALRLEASRLTTNQSVDLSPSLMKNKDVPVRNIPREVFAGMDQHDHRVDMLTEYEVGMGVVGPKVGGNWREWRSDGWEPETIEDVMRQKLRDCGRLGA